MSNDKYQDFIKSFKVALTNCSFYFPKHPKFIKSIDDLKEKIDLIILNKETLSIKVKPELIIIDSDILDDENFSKGLAESLHLMKIKSIFINKNATTQELSEFLLAVAANREVILSSGGMQKVLEAKNVKEIKIEMLDYSSLVKGSGEQVKDVWQYLFDSNKGEESNQKILNFPKSFKNTIEKYGIKQVLGDEKLSAKLIKVLAKLKDQDNDNFKDAIKDLSKAAIEAKDLKLAGSSDQLKELFSSLDSNDLADMLVNLLQSNQELDPSSFDLFSSLISADTNKEAADILNDKINNDKKSFNVEKVKSLFDSFKDESSVPFYRRQLSVLSKKEFLNAEFNLDYDHLYDNYRLILLDLFADEKKPKHLEIILDRISSQMEESAIKGLNYFNKFKEIYDEKIMDQSLVEVLTNKTQAIWYHSEADHFNFDDPSKFSYLLEVLDRSSLEDTYYLDKIFEENRYNELSLRLFFKFFPKDIFELYSRIDYKIKDDSFMKKFIGILKNIDDSISLDVFKYAFNSSALIAKIEILDILKEYSMCDEAFLMELVKCDNFIIRKKGVEVAAKFKFFNKEIVQNLFSSHYYFGFNSKVVLEDLDILEEVFIPESKPHLVRLSKDILFWNKKLKNKAKDILRKYNERSN